MMIERPDRIEAESLSHFHQVEFVLIRFLIRLTPETGQLERHAYFHFASPLSAPLISPHSRVVAVEKAKRHRSGSPGSRFWSPSRFFCIRNRHEPFKRRFLRLLRKNAV